MNPDQLARSGSEHGAQAALFCWAAMNFKRYPQLKLMFAIPNGEARSIVTGARLKATGVKAGVPDIFLPAVTACSPGLYLELKRSGGTISKVQLEWIAALREEGYRVEVCYGWQEAVKVIEDYLNNA